jgi:LmbE family N-acetylglucosaminyl deacetylase
LLTWTRGTLYLAAVSIVLLTVGCVWGQAPVIHGADDRYKLDIMVVVAHPDDEAGFTPLLARAIYDLHKRVGVIFTTRGNSGGNSYGREHGAALADIREIEARASCARLGITDVWFLDGKDTASQDVLYSLGSWGHGANLQKLVGLVRLTRPEVLMTNLPGIFFGENHGDHQAAGILTTEAFDMAGDPVAFPAQVAGDMRRNEAFLENLSPWQPKKLYYSDDTSDTEKFKIEGPSYSVREISPSQKKPYWRLALNAAMTHLTQYPDDIDRLSHMSDADLEKLFNNSDSAWWSEPETFILAKSAVPTKPADDIFAHLDEPLIPAEQLHRPCTTNGQSPTALPSVELAGPWLYLAQFRNVHGLCSIPVAHQPEIAIRMGTTLSIPLVVTHAQTEKIDVHFTLKLPEGWKLKNDWSSVALPAEHSTNLRLDIDTPELSADQLKNTKPQDVTIEATANGKSLGEVKLRVKLGKGGLPQ